MIKCLRCKSITMAARCDNCHYINPPVNTNSTPNESDYIHKKRAHYHLLHSQLVRFKDYVKSTTDDESLKIIFGIAVENTLIEISKFKREHSTIMNQIRELPDNLRCKASGCEEVGTIALGEKWYCRHHSKKYN
jgi:hypothetical protein